MSSMFDLHNSRAIIQSRLLGLYSSCKRWFWYSLFSCPVTSNTLWLRSLHVICDWILCFWGCTLGLKVLGWLGAVFRHGRSKLEEILGCVGILLCKEVVITSVVVFSMVGVVMVLPVFDGSSTLTVVIWEFWCKVIVVVVFLGGGLIGVGSKISLDLGGLVWGLRQCQ